MKQVLDYMREGGAAPLLLVAAAFVALATIFGITFAPNLTTSEAGMRIFPDNKSLIVQEKFEVEIIVDAQVPVNVFSGELRFDPNILKVSTIDYNTSIADLWAELPWYSNGEGTLNFGGGTTRSGGFVGSGTLITVTFETKKAGSGVVSLYGPRVFRHDGLGTDANLAEMKDAIFVVSDPEIRSQRSDTETVFVVAKDPPSTDLNGDGKQTIADVSVFMMHIVGNDTRYDFNQDGEVGLKDLNILLGK